ncbi:uncharacterized protein LOC135691100 isoform X2 [Rhopilema esculentum]|uniref:uncharacterized protein LOC135691100 isoform X2 n=1 Tax=Rhopilema esculentum TaxID=499914 RepID=UPI0031CE1076
MKELLGLSLLLLIWGLEVSCSHKCTNEQGCCVETLNLAATCRDAEIHCARWQNETEKNGFPLPDSVRRMSPWDVTCSLEEYFCPLTFQCINKTDSCTFNTTYVGDCYGNSSTPWGTPCPANHTYCPLLASCIPAGYPCSLQELSNYLQDNTLAYFGVSCQQDEIFCPGTQSCILNTTVCDYNSSLSVLNITCPGNETYCVDERKCVSGSCSMPNLPVFNFNDSNTGWMQFCTNFKYICPKILSVENNCKPLVGASPICDPKCGRSPFQNCHCPPGRYKCNMKSACYNETAPCVEPPTASVCPSIYVSPSTVFWDPSSSVDQSSMFVNESVYVQPSPSPNESLSVLPSSSIYATSAPSVCNYTCKAGFVYCHSLAACVMEGYNHCGKVHPYCQRNHLYCASQGKCVKVQEGCPSVTITVDLSSTYDIIQTVFNISSSYEPSLSYFQSETAFVDFSTSIPPIFVSSEAISLEVSASSQQSIISMSPTSEYSSPLMTPSAFTSAQSSPESSLSSLVTSEVSSLLEPTSESSSSSLVASVVSSSSQPKSAPSSSSLVESVVSSSSQHTSALSSSSLVAPTVSFSAPPTLASSKSSQMTYEVLSSLELVSESSSSSLETSETSSSSHPTSESSSSSLVASVVSSSSQPKSAPSSSSLVESVVSSSSQHTSALSSSSLVAPTVSFSAPPTLASSKSSQMTYEVLSSLELVSESSSPSLETSETSSSSHPTSASSSSSLETSEVSSLLEPTSESSSSSLVASVVSSSSQHTSALSSSSLVAPTVSFSAPPTLASSKSSQMTYEVLSSLEIVSESSSPSLETSETSSSSHPTSASTSSSLETSEVSSLLEPTSASSSSSLVASVVSSSSQHTSALSSSSLVAPTVSFSAPPTLASSKSSQMTYEVLSSLELVSESSSPSLETSETSSSLQPMSASSLMTSVVSSSTQPKSASSSSSLVASVVFSLSQSASESPLSTLETPESSSSLQLTSASSLLASVVSSSSQPKSASSSPSLETSEVSSLLEPTSASSSSSLVASAVFSSAQPTLASSTSSLLTSAVPSSPNSTLVTSSSPLVASHVICQLVKSKPTTRPLFDMEPPLHMSKKIAIIGANLNATWSAFYNSAWHIVSNFSATNALVLGHTDKLHVHPRITYHGEIPVVVAEVPSSFASGSRINVTTGYRIYHLVILLMPHLPLAKFSSTLIKTLQYNKAYDVRFPISAIVRVDKPNLQVKLNLIDHLRDNSLCIGNYIALVANISRCSPFVELNIQGSNLKTDSTGIIAFSTDQTLTKISMRTGYNCPTRTVYTSNETQVIIDLRKCPPESIRMPHIPYGSSMIAEGTLITSLSGFESGKLGMAVVFAPSSSNIGYYEYQNYPNGPWHKIELKTFPVVKANNDVPALFLNETTRIRFNPANISGSTWTELEARKNASLRAVGWDMSDTKESGMRTVRIGQSAAGYCSDYKRFTCCMSFVLTQMKISGCDKQPGSKMKLNSCGECSSVENDIYKRCNDCHAVIDDCNKCTNGSTGLAKNYMQDCAGQCGEFYTDSCGNCINKANPKNFTDCTGSCNGTAAINKCGHCVGGTTGLPLNHGIDPCGTCKNDSSSCADCAGVPNGGKKRDLCNLCRLPTDAIFNTECRRLGRCNVTVLPNDAQYAIGCNGAGIDVFISVTCKLVSSSQNIDAAEPKLEKFNTKVIGVSLKLPSSVAVGDYKVRCTFPAQDPVPQFTDDSKNSIYIYSKSGITYAERTPVEHEVGFPFDLTITGSGFFNSSYLKCITQDGRHLNATFVSSTTVKCHIPAIRRSINLSLTLSWSPVDRVFNKAKHVNVSLFSYAANITSAKFQDNLGFIDIILDRASKPVDISSTCSSFFSDISTLGTGAICKFSGLRRFTIKLGKQATIKPNDTLIFKSASIKDFHGDVTKYTVATQSVFIASPVNVVYPEAVLTTSSEVANCAGIKLVGRQSSGGGGRPLEFYWSLSVNNDVNSSHPDLVDYRNLLSALPTTARVVTLPKKAGLVNIPITFKLTVKNFLGMQGHDSKIVTRASRIKPSLHVGKTKRTNIISEVLLIGAQATIDASCGVESKILYNWYSINGSTISLPNARNLYLPPRTMKPGLRYQFTVTAALATDPDSTATATITILTVASPLVPRLIMPSSVGINDIVVFDLSKSSDPDQTAETQHCQIEFKIGTASVYRKVDGTFKPVIYTGCIRHKVQINTFLEGDKNYTVVLTYKKGLRVAISSKRLKTEKKSRPLVYLETSSTKKVPTSVLFSIEAKIVAIDFSGDINYYWHCQECAGFDLEASKVKKSETKATKKLKIGATIDATLAIAAFKLPPGATLSFILTACGKVGDSTVCGSAVQNITTSSPPSSCVFAVSPSSGIAFQTLFTFEASYCNDDAPDKPLKYIFGFLDESGKENAINDAGEDSQLSDVRSRSGILTAYVKVMDKNGDSVRLEFTINVSKRAIPPSEVTAQVSIIADTASIDITVAAYQITILIESSDVIADENSEEAEEKRQVQSTALAVVSRNTNGVKTSSQKVIVAISVKSCFKGMTKKNARPEMVKTMSKIFVQFVVTEKKTSRRRRSVTPAPVTPITVSEAETYLEPFRTLDPNKTDNDTLTAKNNFLILLPSLLKGMCRNSLFNVPASVAKTTTAVLQTFKVDFGSTGNSEIQLGCTDCTDMIKNASYLQLGQTLIDQYSSFVCNPNGENCTGACIASAQMPLDYLSTPPVSKRLSAVLLIQFWNPDEMYAAEELTPSALANPMIVKMPLQTTTLATYVCKLWDSASKTWGESGTMTVSQTLITVSNTSYIKCAINQTGYVSIFEGPPLRMYLFVLLSMTLSHDNESLAWSLKNFELLIILGTTAF